MLRDVVSIAVSAGRVRRMLPRERSSEPDERIQTKATLVMTGSLAGPADVARLFSGLEA
jgi:hypothetical protein